MEKNISARTEAIKEISKEKARIFGKKTQTPSLLEKVALTWKKRKEIEARKNEVYKKDVSGGHSIRGTLAREIVDYDKRKIFDSSRTKSTDETGWVQFNPWKKEEDKKKKQIPLNMATVVAIRKKLIAMEWARALGKRTRETGFNNLEHEAAMLKQKREEGEKRKEEMTLRIERHKKVLSEALTEFGKRLRDQKDNTDPEALLYLLEEQLENAGEVFDIEWQESGCLVWMEPWEEKKLRRILEVDIPVIYRVRIDKNFEITSFERVEDEEVIKSLRGELLIKSLRESLEGMFFNIDDEEQAQQFLENKLFEIGRIIDLERRKEGWLATIEPWEEMRLRNVKRGGKPSIVTEKIEINWQDGKLEFETQRPQNSRKDRCENF